MDARGQSGSDDARRPASKRQRQGDGQACVSGTGQPGLIDGPLPPFQRVRLDAWLKLMRLEDFDLLVGAVRAEQIRRGSGSACAAASDSTHPLCVMRQQTPARVGLSDFPPEIPPSFSRMWTQRRCWAPSHTCAATGVLRAPTTPTGPRCG